MTEMFKKFKGTKISQLEARFLQGNAQYFGYKFI